MKGYTVSKDSKTGLWYAHMEGFASGVRADDMALRLKYAGFDTGRIEVIRDYENLLEAIGADETPTFIMPTYTAMFDLRGEISKHTDIKAFYE